MEVLIDYNSMVESMFKDDIELCREMVKRGIEKYRKSGDDKDVTFILLNLGRIIKARGYKDFESLNLTNSQIDNAIKSEGNHNRNIINKMFEALKIKGRI